MNELNKIILFVIGFFIVIYTLAASLEYKNMNNNVLTYHNKDK